jgi:hypothetical protein
MSITATELRASQSGSAGNSPSWTLQYRVTGSAHGTSIAQWLGTGTATTFGGLPRDRIDIEPVYVDTSSSSGEWTATLTYTLSSASQTSAPTADTGDEVYSFDTGGATEHISYALDIIEGQAPTGQPVPDTGGAIGYDGERVQGLDVTSRRHEMQVQFYVAQTNMTQAFQDKLYLLTGHVNSDAIEIPTGAGTAVRSFGAGTVLFQGASGSVRGVGDWEITARMAAVPNVATGAGQLVIGATNGVYVQFTNGVSGWDYVDVRWTEATNTAGLIAVPAYAHILRVYPRASFTNVFPSWA